MHSIPALRRSEQRSSASGSVRTTSTTASSSTHGVSALYVNQWGSRAAVSSRSWRSSSPIPSSARRSSRTRSATSSTRGRFRTPSIPFPSPAPRAATSGTTTASGTSTSPPSSSTSRSTTLGCWWPIEEQADKLCTIGPPMATEARSTLARMLAEITPGDLEMSFFTNGGAEANENAIKLARWYTGRHKVIARYRSYHGATAGAITLTGDPRRWPAEPGLPGVLRMFDPYTYRCPAGHPDPCPVCSGAPHLEEILQYEGPQTVAAVIMETVTGTNGVIVPPEGYLQSIREVCNRHGIVLVFDEVMAGFGRTGRWFAFENL